MLQVVLSKSRQDLLKMRQIFSICRCRPAISRYLPIGRLPESRLTGALPISAWCSTKFDFETTCEIGLGGEADCFGGLADGFAGFQVVKGLIQAVTSNIRGWGITCQSLEFSLQLAFAYTHFFRHHRKVKIPARKILLHHAVKLVKEHIWTTSRSDIEISSHTTDILILPDRKRY